MGLWGSLRPWNYSGHDGMSPTISIAAADVDYGYFIGSKTVIIEIVINMIYVLNYKLCSNCPKFASTQA